MTKKAAIALALIMLVIVAWGLFVEGGATKIVINGEELTGPLKGAVGAAGLIIASIALFCAAILLVFVFAGAGIFVLGGHYPRWTGPSRYYVAVPAVHAYSPRHRLDIRRHRRAWILTAREPELLRKTVAT
jgi:hypothetical protein